MQYKKPYTVIRPDQYKKELAEEKRKRIEILCISIFIILLGLVFGYWTALHISAEELEDGSEEKDTTTTEINDIRESIDNINEQIELLNNKIENEVDRLDEENQIINNYLIIQNDLNDIQDQVNQLEELAEEPEESEEIVEDIIVDTESRLMGDWVLDYPYIRGTLEILVLLIAFIFLWNLVYCLFKLISGDR